MKKYVALLLVLSLFVSLSLPAVAADLAFTDVEEGSYYYEAVYWAVENHVTNGTSANAFSPNEQATRAQVVTFLWRAAGSPEPTAAESDFTDVRAGAYYEQAVFWAAETGVTSGTSATTFSPDKLCTRAQVVTFLWRAAGSPEPAAEAKGGFSDVSAGSYYEKAVVWAAATGVTTGTGATTFSPDGKCTRGQIVTFLWRFADWQAAQDPSFTERTVPVLHDSLDSAETATLRVYEDLPNVPYMSITDFYNQFYLIGTELSEGMRFTRTGSTYVVDSFTGSSATFDVRTESIVIDDANLFLRPAYYLQIELAGISDDNYPFLLQTNSMEPAEPAALTLELSDYDIDIRGDETGVYLPLATLCDLYATQDLIYVVYSGKKIYTQDFAGALQRGSALEEDPDYIPAVRADRAPDLAEFTYRELCFNLDLWYGQPGQEWIHEDLLSASFDEILSSKYPEIKEMLLASDFETFFSGLYHVFMGILFDGGHTWIPSRVMYENASLWYQNYDALLAEDYGIGLYNYYETEWQRDTLRRSARESFYNGEFYLEQGDTAIIVFDVFIVDSDAWNAYYAGNGERPLEGDTVGTILTGLERASQNPEIKNIILDVSCNGGGDSAALIALEWLMTGSGYIRFANAQTGQIDTQSAQIDVNFDGVFDELDVSPFTQFRYGVLTSSGSFSCGNAYPWFMHEHGAMILGEQSGGGACAIRRTVVGGIECQISSNTSRIVTDAGGSVDAGCPVDAELLTEGENPYINFYDLPLLGEKMNEFFEGVPEDPA